MRGNRRNTYGFYITLERRELFGDRRARIDFEKKLKILATLFADPKLYTEVVGALIEAEELGHSLDLFFGCIVISLFRRSPSDIAELDE